MEQKPILYTYGNIQIRAEELIHLLLPHHINCVVDCRPQNNSPIAQNTPTDELRTILKQYQIIYFPFFNHFGFFSSEVRNKKGEPVYRKVIQAENFLQGIERIQHGIQKGYQICIIDNQKETDKSKRFTLIGKYMKGTYEMRHLTPTGTFFTQEAQEQRINEYAIKRKELKKMAEEIGKTGEELSARYLEQQGYQILDHNWNLHRGCELDLVAMRDNTLHFIEVKTRTSDKYGDPQTAINRVKMRHILKAIHEYRYRHAFFHTNYQIDSIAIIYHSDRNYQLKHFLDIRPNGEACADVHIYTLQQ